MTQKLALLVFGGAKVFSSSAPSQVPTPPEIEVISAQRIARIGAEADGGIIDGDEATSMIPGPFIENFTAEVAGAAGSTATGSASQSSNTSTFSIYGNGLVDVSANVLPTELALSGGSSSISFGFKIQVDAPISFTGTLDSSIESAASARAEVSLSSTAPDSSPIFFKHSMVGHGSICYPFLEEE